MQIQEALEARPHGVISMLGMRGKGKTWLSAALKFPTMDRIIYIDVVGAVRKLLDKSAEIIEVDTLPAASALKNVFVKVKARSIVFDISNMKRDDMAQFTDMLCDYLLTECKEQIALVVDEVGEICPQDMAVYAHRLESVVRMGRNKSIQFVVLATQRPQKVNKHLLTMSDLYVVFGFVHNLDTGAVRDVLGDSRESFVDKEMKIKQLGIGEYMLTDGLNVWWYYRERTPETIKPEPVEKGQKRLEVVENEEGRQAEARSGGDNARGGISGKTRRGRGELSRQIAELTKKGFKPKQIAKKIGVPARYVYETNRRWRKMKNGTWKNKSKKV